MVRLQCVTVKRTYYTCSLAPQTPVICLQVVFGGVRAVGQCAIDCVRCGSEQERGVELSLLISPWHLSPPPPCTAGSEEWEKVFYVCASICAHGHSSRAVRPLEWWLMHVHYMCAWRDCHGSLPLPLPQTQWGRGRCTT
jgi:hypothetical protein